MLTEYPPGSELAPAYNSLLPLYFILFAWVSGWIFGHRFTDWPVDRENEPGAQYGSDLNLLQETLRTIRSRLSSGIAGFTVLAFGAVAACGVDLNVAPKGGVVVDAGMFVNSVIQIVSGYRSGLMTKSVSICHRLQRAAIEFEMGHRNAIGMVVGREHRVRGTEWPPKGLPSTALAEDLRQARRACFVGGSAFVCLWVISTCLMSVIGLSRGAEGLYVIMPSAWAMACLSVPIGRFLAALFDPWRIRAATC
jgi:hypothetical protein